jgi:hypothetical protein
LKNLKVFGAKAYINVIRTRKDKLDERSMKRTLVGIDKKIEKEVLHITTPRICHPRTKRINLQPQRNPIWI